jgi:hypothetical protein
MVVMVKTTKIHQFFEVVNKRRKSNRFTLGGANIKEAEGGIRNLTMYQEISIVINFRVLFKQWFPTKSL